MSKSMQATLIVVAMSWAGSATAKPIAPTVFCSTYPDAPACMGGVPACTFCHTTPPARNVFGAALSAKLLVGTPRPLSDGDFESGLPEALRLNEDDDADGDGFTNIDEILAGTYPSDERNAPVDAGCPKSSEDNGGFDVCNYDARYVFKKVHLDFCGTTVAYDRLKAFDQLNDKDAEIHAAVDRCLDTSNWLGPDGALYRIAHAKIRPAQSIKSGQGAGDIPLGDYDDDYRLFVYTQIDNHDARELLTAQYFVEINDEDPPHYSTFTRNVLQDVGARGVEVAQLVEPARRAGLLTSRWNLVLNTMFTTIPRTTAAQAYRAFLGLDIARMEGLEDVPNEPVDYDQKGVQAEACRRCHATLDPLTYPFSRYNGLNGGVPASYAPDRLNTLSSGQNDPLRNTPEEGVIFGQRVANLLEWGQVAANSDQFARATVLDYWKYLMGELPRPTEQAEFDRIWRAFKNEHEYSVERMLHDLVTTEAYGVP